MPETRRKLLVLYHFFHPDEVVSARIFSDFAVEQARRGWDVTAFTTNRAHADLTVRYPARESWQGVEIHRVFRPAWSQKKPALRMANSAWTLAAWYRAARALGPVDAIVIGSDPTFAATVAIPLRALRPRASIIHWCFDLYPEAGEAEWQGAVRWLTPPARAVMGVAYRACDAIVDLGPCMRERLSLYDSAPVRATLTPWALVESDAPAEPDLTVRREIFGDAKLGLLYAGSMARPHDYAGLLALARACRARVGDEIVMCFACTGTNLPALRAAVGPEDTNVRFAPFTDEAGLAARLAAADFHVGSLRPEYAGIVVPSKFFAALAAGRPFIFAGTPAMSVAQWIREHDVGLVLEPGRAAEIADALVALKDDPGRLHAGRARALAAYQRHFSKGVVNDRWAALLDDLRRTS